jgi:hypothetical protein
MSSKVLVLRVKMKSGATFYTMDCSPRNVHHVALVHEQWQGMERVWMTQEQYNAIGATNEAATFFAALDKQGKDQ